jgi:hypothetical protein
MTKTNRESTKESIERIDAAEKRQDEGPPELVLSTGVKLRILKVAPVLLSDIVGEQMKFRPKPPVNYIESLGREEENPDDPDYIEALNNWNAMILLDINNAYVLKGTEVISKPKKFPGPDDPDFLDEMRILGRPVETNRQKYLVWIKYVAAPTEEDTAAIVREVGRLTGVSEAEVEEAIEGFQR